MKITEWLKGLIGKKPGTIDVSGYSNGGEGAIALEAFAICTVVDMLARLVAKCEFKTYKDGVEQKGAEWVSLNVKPNRNQTATEFWQEALCRLLFYGEILIVTTNDGQKVIAESFEKTEYALADDKFEDVERGDFTFQKTFYSRDVFYLRYASLDKRLYLHSVCAMYESLMISASDKYHKSGGEKGVLEISAKAQGEHDFEQRFQKLMNQYFASWFKSKNAVLPLFDGYKYTPSTSDAAKKYSNEVSDIKTLADEALARAAQAFGVPPALVRGDVAGIHDAYDVLLTGCIDPLADMISEELTGKMFSPEEIAAGCEIAADTSCIKHVDIFEVAAHADKLIASGLLSPNGVREKAGLKPIREKWAGMHYMTKNYMTTEQTLKGGE